MYVHTAIDLTDSSVTFTNLKSSRAISFNLGFQFSERHTNDGDAIISYFAQESLHLESYTIIITKNERTDDIVAISIQSPKMFIMFFILKSYTA